MIVHKVNYYDSYSDIPNLPFTNHSGYSNMLKGLLIATKTRVLDSNPVQWIWSVNDYDDDAQVVRQSRTNHLGGNDIITNEYNFSGQLVKTSQEHSTPLSGRTITISTKNEYDHVGRLLEAKKRINEQPEVIQAKLAYNEIGQLIGRSVHSEDNGVTFWNTTSFAYNERGWQRKVGTPFFSYQLNYNVDNGGTVLNNAQYNGNISQQQWGHKFAMNRTFNYTYDNLDRLILGVSLDSIKIKEELSYDDMGNIKSLRRDDGTAFGYNYANDNKSNRLTGLSGGIGGNYTCDDNGNSLTDRLGITLTYNYLNLPKSAKRVGGTDPIEISYIYDAGGNKLRKVSSKEGDRNYIGGIEYSGNNIERIGTEEGYLLRNGTNYSYYYALKDHLGNIRSVIYKNPTTNKIEPIQKQDYYPFGKTKGILSGGNNKYLYNGKEIQQDLGGQLDYGARLYDAEIGRWSVADAMADEPEQLDKSPYAYGWNNPVNLTDPDGNCPNCITAGIGVLVGGGVELASQLISGKKLDEVDWADVGVEALKGGLLGSGVGAGAAAGIEAGGLVAKATLDVSKKDGVKNYFSGTKSGGETLYDGVVDYAGGKAVGALGKKMTTYASKAVTKSIKTEVKAVKAVVQASNKFNKVTNGGRQMEGAKSLAATSKLVSAKSTLQNASRASAAAKSNQKLFTGNHATAVRNGATAGFTEKLKKWLDIK